MPAILKTKNTVLSTVAGVATPVSQVSIKCSSIIFQAASANTGNVYFGASNVTTSNGIHIAKNETFELTFDNQYGNNNILDLSSLYFDTDNTGNTVKVAYIQWITPDALT